MQSLQVEMMALRSAFGCLAQCLHERGALNAGDLVDRIQDSASLQLDARLRAALEDIAAAVSFECEMSARPVAPVLRLVGED